jgi:MoaA/NifB/PqqE/SkfB family radical SAM enzyme
MSITEHIDAVTRIPASHLKAECPAPKSVKIEISPRCNFRCGFCALRTREKQPKDDIDFSLFQRATTEMRIAGVEEIGLFYLGESTMNPELLLACLRHVKALGFPYTFLTCNASLADPTLVGELMAAGLDSLKWSVNAADAAQFAEVMGVVPKLFEQAKANIRAAHAVRQALRAEGRGNTSLYASSIRYDGTQQARMEVFLAEHVFPYVDEHYWLPLYSMGSFATSREEELGYKPIAGNQGRLGALRDPLPCWSAFTEGHLTAEGKLSACCFDAKATWTMGDLTQQSFMDAWNSPAFVALRAAHLRKDVHGTVCEECVAYKG